MRKKYKYIVYTKITDIFDNWVFINKEAIFNRKIDAVEYLSKKIEDTINNEHLSASDVNIGEHSFENFKTRSFSWIQSKEV